MNIQEDELAKIIYIMLMNANCIRSFDEAKEIASTISRSCDVFSESEMSLQNWLFALGSDIQVDQINMKTDIKYKEVWRK